MYLGGRGTVLRRAEVTYVDKNVIRRSKENKYTSRLAVSVRDDLDVAGRVSVADSLEYVMNSGLFDIIHLLSNFEY